MNRSVFRFAWLELRRSTPGSSVPKGIGASDFGWLTMFFFTLTLLAYIAISVATSVPFRIEQTLLGAVEPGRKPVRLTINFLRQTGIDTRTELHLVSDPQLAGLSMAPQRDLRLREGGLLAFPIPSVGENKAAGMPALAIGRNAPIWTWLESDLADGQTMGGELDRFVIGNEGQFEADYPFSAGLYAQYRDVVLSREETRSLARYLPAPETVSRWSDLDHIVLAVIERGKSENGRANTSTSTRLHPFRIIWRPGVPLPENVALVFPLAFVDLLEAATLNGGFSFAPEGAGGVATRYTDIIADTDIAGNAARFALVTGMQDVGMCLGGDIAPWPLKDPDDHYEMRYETQPGQPEFLAEDVRHCLRRAGFEADKILGSPSGWHGQNGVTARKTGIPTGRISHNGIQLNSIFAIPCAAMDIQGHNDALLNAHPSFDTCNPRNPAAAPSGDAPLAGALFTDKYDRVTFVQASDHRAKASPEESLAAWTVNGAKTGDADPVTFDLSALSDDARAKHRATIDQQKGTATETDDSMRVFRLDPGYKKALAQSELMLVMLSVVGSLVLAVTGVFFIFLIYIKQFSLLEYRLSQYMLLSLYGFSKAHLRSLILFQAAFCALLGSLISAVLAPLAIMGMNLHMWRGDFRDNVLTSLGFRLDQLLLVPHPFWFALVTGLAVCLSVGLAVGVALRKNIISASFPSQILYGNAR